jgi:hypothetical protein
MAESKELCDRINELEKNMQLILLKLDSIENGTGKMSKHIDFINEVYIKVQTPLFWFCDKVNYLKAYKYYASYTVEDKDSGIKDSSKDSGIKGSGINEQD